MEVRNAGVSVATEKKQPAPLFPVGHLLPFSLVTVLFFLWGIPNNLNDVAVYALAGSRPSYERS